MLRGAESPSRNLFEQILDGYLPRVLERRLTCSQEDRRPRSLFWLQIPEEWTITRPLSVKQVVREGCWMLKLFQLAGKLKSGDAFRGSQIELGTKSNKKIWATQKVFVPFWWQFTFDFTSVVSHKLFSNKAIYLEAFRILPTSRLFPWPSQTPGHKKPRGNISLLGVCLASARPNLISVFISSF